MGLLQWACVTGQTFEILRKGLIITFPEICDDFVMTLVWRFCDVAVIAGLCGSANVTVVTNPIAWDSTDNDIPRAQFYCNFSAITNIVVAVLLRFWNLAQSQSFHACNLFSLSPCLSKGQGAFFNLCRQNKSIRHMELLTYFVLVNRSFHTMTMGTHTVFCLSFTFNTHKYKPHTHNTHLCLMCVRPQPRSDWGSQWRVLWSVSC